MSFLSRLLGSAPGSAATNAPSNIPSNIPSTIPSNGVGAPPTRERRSADQPSEAGVSASADAVANLGFGEPLLRLALDAGPAQRLAQKRLAELIDSRAIGIEQLPYDAATRDAILAIAAHAADPVVFDTLAAAIVEAEIWIGLATKGASAKLRQLAAARLVTPEHLRAVMKAARDSDKNVYRIAKAKLDAIHAEAKRATELRAHMHSIADTIERHSHKPFDGAYVAAIDHLVREWAAIDIEIPSDVQTRVTSAIDRAREVIASHIQAAGAQAAYESAVAHAQPLRLNTLEELRRILSALYAAETFDAPAAASVTERLTKLTQRWDDTLQYQSASKPEQAQFDALQRAVQRVSDSIAAKGTLQQRLQRGQSEPQSLDQVEELLRERALLGESLPDGVSSALELTTRWRREQAALRAAREDAERHLAQLVRKAQHALAGGRSRQALGMRRTIDAKAKQLATVPKPIADRLQQLDDKLAELQDWKSFAVTPKRSELIAQMQELIGIEAEPAELAERIKRLQEEWKALAKGSSDSEEDWTKFHEAAQAAYQPCKVYFEAQAQLRARNLQQRKDLVARLARYEEETNWDQVDWKNVANALRAAKQEWRTSHPTDRGATKPIEKRFDESLARIQARLDAEYSANLERKQALLVQAQRLAGASDLVQASNDVKRLQSAWRNVGITPHQEGQRLWDEFKRSCDAVFDKRRAEHTERMAELEQHEEQAQALCIELENLAQLSGAPLFAAAARTRELHDAFAALGELPRDTAHEIQRRFKRAHEQFEHAIKQQRQRDIDQAWDHFFAAANRIRRHQLEGGDSADVATYLASIEHWPKGGKHALEHKFAHPASAALDDNAAQLRSLAIKAEIAAGTSTPEADQSQRRTMQLQALVKGIGRTTASVPEQLEALAFEWVAVGPVANTVYDELFARFKRAWGAGRR